MKQHMLYDGRTRLRCSSHSGAYAVVVVFLCLLFSVTEELSAQVEWKDRYVTLAELDQKHQSIARPTREDYTVVVWEDERPGSNGADIYAQKIDNNTGLALWEPVDGVPICIADGDQRLPRAAYDTLGGVIIVWEDHRDAFAQNGIAWNVKIYGHRVDLSTGALDPVWGATPDGLSISAAADGNTRAPRIVCTGAGAYIAWTDYRNAVFQAGSYTNTDIYLTYLESATAAPVPNNCSGMSSYPQDGNPVTVDTHDQRNPELALDNIWRPYCITTGGGQQTILQVGVTVVFEDNRITSGTLGVPVWNLFTHAYGVDGQTIWATFNGTMLNPAMQAEVPIAVSDFDQLHVQLASTGGVPGAINAGGVPSLGVVAVWEDMRDDPQQQNQIAEVYSHLVWPENPPFVGWASVLNLTNSSADQRSPCVAVHDASGGDTRAYVAWHDARDFGSTSLDVYADAIEVANGTAIYAQSGQATSTTAGDQRTPAIDVHGDAQQHFVVIAWEDARNGTATDIFCQVFNEDLIGYTRTQDGDPVTAAANTQTDVCVNRDMFVWNDARRGSITNDNRSDLNIYAQKLGDECDGDVRLNWREMYAKWAQNTEAENHRMVTDPDGNTFVVWNEDRPVGEYSETQKVFIQKFDKDGVPRYTNGGMLLSDPSLDATRPAVSFDAIGGAYVAWQETEYGQSDSYVTVKRVDAQSIIKWIWTSAGSSDVKPVLCEDVYMDAYAVPTYYPRVILAYTTSNSAVSRYMDSSSTMGQPYTVMGDWESIKIVTDYRRGCWMMYQSTFVLQAGHFTLGYQQQDPGSSTTSFSYSSGAGYDITVDPFPVHRFPNHYYPHDCLFVFSEQVGGVNQLKVGRIIQVDDKPTIEYRIINDVLATTGHSTLPTIAADSIPSEQIGDFSRMAGALISWDDEYGASSLHRVLSNRVRWTYNYVLDTYGAIAQFLDQNYDPDHAILADSCESLTYPDIVRLNTTIPYPTISNPPPVYVFLRFGATVWKDDRGLGCPPTSAVRLMVADYTDWITTGANAIALGQIGAVVSPLLGTFEQSNPAITCGRDNTMHISWGDTRAGSTAVLGTRLSFHETNKVESWMKSPRPMSIPLPHSVEIAGIFPQPALTGNAIHVRLVLPHPATVRLQVYDLTGRQVTAPLIRALGEGGHTIVFGSIETAALPPGIYRCVCETEGLSISRSFVLVR